MSDDDQNEIAKAQVFKSVLQGRPVTGEERTRSCPRCGRIFSSPESANRPHLSEAGMDCPPKIP